MLLAPGQEAAAQIAGAQVVLEQELGGDLRGIHLFGSALDGGLKPCSDIDLMVSVARPLPKAVQRALLRELLAHSARPGSSRVLRALEVTVVALSELVPWRYPPRREMQFGEWLRKDIRAGRYEPARPDHDLAILITKVLRHSVALFGPPARDLFENVPASDFRQSLADTLSRWNAPSDWSGDERNVVLALARIWYSARTGKIASKERAAAWAADRLPAEHRELVQRAARAYLGGNEDALVGTQEEVARTIGFCKSAAEQELGLRR